jgi:hypothetical protein
MAAEAVIVIGSTAPKQCWRAKAATFGKGGGEHLKGRVVDSDEMRWTATRCGGFVA